MPGDYICDLTNNYNINSYYYQHKSYIYSTNDLEVYDISYVCNGEINIHNICNDTNLASFMTKPSNKGRHTCH